MKNKLSYRTKFTLTIIFAPILIVGLIFGWTRDGHLGISRKLKYSIVFIGAYVSILSYKYGMMKKEK